MRWGCNLVLLCKGSPLGRFSPGTLIGPICGSHQDGLGEVGYIVSRAEMQSSANFF